MGTTNSKRIESQSRLAKKAIEEMSAEASLPSIQIYPNENDLFFGNKNHIKFSKIINVIIFAILRMNTTRCLIHTQV